MITVNFSEGSPLYRQICRQIQQDIAQGHILPEEKLPSQRLLARHLGVSLNTVKLAYQQLTDEDYLVAVPRVGHFVDKLQPEMWPHEAKRERLPREAVSLPKCAIDLSYSGIDREKFPRKAWHKAEKMALDQLLQGQSTEPFGWLALRQQIARYLYERRGTAVAPTDVILATGHEELVRCLCQLLPEHILAIEKPGYKVSAEAIQAGGHDFLEIPIDRYGFSVKDLEKTAANLVICTPDHQFPTGIFMGMRRRERLLDWAYQKPDRYILEDDYDGDFKYTGFSLPTLKSLDSRDRVILAGSFSASLGPFVGISYCVLPPALKNRLAVDKLAPSQPAGLVQAALANFMAAGEFDRHLNRMNSHYRKKSLAWQEALSGTDLLKVQGGEAGLYLLLDLGASFPEARFAQKLAAAGIRLAPLSHYAGGLFGQPQGRYLLGFGQVPLQAISAVARQLLEIIRDCRREPDGRKAGPFSSCRSSGIKL